MQIKELDHVVLGVRDLERSRRFYRDVPGWREIAAGGMAAAYSSGRTHHELRAALAEIRRHGVALIGSAGPEQGHAAGAAAAALNDLRGEFVGI
jgi:catechol 2,3-dioxygenase-like lactoylglutathione lyase family enzyme